MSDQEDKKQLLEYTAEIVAAHVSNNTLAAEEVPQLIREVYSTVAGLNGQPDRPERPQPAVPISESVKPDYLVCLDDGKKLKMLKRHLKAVYNMTPEQYREKWGLRPDYPMVAPNYAAQRSSLAKKIGLGTKTRRPSKVRAAHRKTL